MSTAVRTATFSGLSTKFQVGTAALALATAASVTPVIAHASPSIAPFVQGVGDSASLVIDSPVVPTAAASAAVTADPCSTVNFKLGCYAVQGAVDGTMAIVRGVGIFVGTTVYVVVAATGEIFKAVGSFLPGQLGEFFTNVGDGVSAFANDFAQRFHVGPYLSGQ
ncbi:hypothetical protein B1R94_04975 [Mycolicibacterium litorale]|nr:hypothetical protein B1R94_04975 [Mycolicibacterium litorale]